MPGNRRCTSAISGLTTERFCFSDLMSPSSTSRVRAPTYTPAPAPAADRSGPRLLPHLERLDHVTDLDVAVTESDAALEALPDLGRVVLEPAQRIDAEVVRDDDAVADEAGLAVAGDRARADDAACDIADPRHPEDLANLGGTELGLLEDRLEHAPERGLDFLDRLVDDRVVADVHALALGQLAGPARGPDVEADDHGLGGDGQVDVVLGDRAHAAADDPQGHFLAHVELDERVLQGLDRAGDVALDDEQQLFPLAGLERGLQVLQGDPRPPLGEHRAALPGLAPLGDLPGHPVVVDHQEVVAGTGDGGQAEHLHRPGRHGLGDLAAVLVQHGADPAEGLAGHDRVTDVQRAALHQDGRDRAAALVQVRLNGHALGLLLRVGPEVQLGVRG